MSSKRVPLTTLMALTIFLAACVRPPLILQSNQETLFQVSTLSSLQAGSYDGTMTIGELVRHGDFGLGTFNALDGEMVVVDGEVFQIKDDGLAYLADSDIQTPFAVVTFFRPEQTATVKESLDCTQLQTHLDTLLAGINGLYAIKVSGTFASLTVRAPQKQSQPYPPLAEALANQSIFNTQNATGTMVGFRLPDSIADFNTAGYHFHFISADRQTGGHVLDCETADLSVEIDPIEHFRMDPPETGTSPQASLTTGSQPSSAQPLPTDAIVLGALYNLTGFQAALDIPSAQGAQLAVDEVNQAGGVLGRRLQLVIADGESDPAVLTEKTTEILTQYPDVTALMGLSDADMVLGAAPVAAVAQRLFVTSGATSPLLPEQVPGYLFLACFGDNVQAAAGAEWAYSGLSARTAAILYDASTQYAQGLQRYFATRFEELGGEVVSVQHFTTGDLGALSQAIDGLDEADVIFVSAGPEDSPEAARRLRRAGFTAPILGGDGFDSGTLWAQYTDIDNLYFTTHAYLGADNPDPTLQAFRTAYLARYPDALPDAFAALGYDAARLLVTAIEKAGSAAPGDVLRALSAIEEFDGVTGQMSFTPGNPIPTKSVTILAIEDGRYRYVTELAPVSVPAPHATFELLRQPFVFVHLSHFLFS